MSRRFSTLRLFTAAASAALLPNAAWAHVGHGSTVGFVHGFVHPVTGLDHVLAMVAIGMFAAHLGGRAVWAVTATFVAAMALGGGLGFAGIAVPFVETGIAVSVIVLGLAVALQWKAPVVAAMALAGLFAIFHGHAHGAEMPADAGGLAYGAGFLLATAALHGIGIAMITLGRVHAPRAIPLGGLAMASAGVGIMAGVI